MSAAFDTVDHHILPVRLKTSFGIGGSVLAWLKSIVPNSIDNGVFFSFPLVMCGVPQGSVLGPLLFLFYTADVALIAQRHHVAVHLYADNMQLYASCSATDGSN